MATVEYVNEPGDFVEAHYRQATAKDPIIIRYRRSRGAGEVVLTLHADNEVYQARVRIEEGYEAAREVAHSLVEAVKGYTPHVEIQD